MNQQEPKRRSPQFDPTIASLNALDVALESQKLELETVEFLRDLLPVFDGVLTMCRGLEQRSPNEIIDTAEGLSILADITDQALSRIEMKRLGQVGEVIDASCYEVIDTRSREDVPRGTVIEVLEYGWVYQGKVLRAARVVASITTSEADSE
ncbi:MAG: nucleotide exchange factor GrpE [Planctomycetes bacterium]|nr:nucleotide exchange factor GrpE [Planctomycetota bacterium]